MDIRSDDSNDQFLSVLKVLLNLLSDVVLRDLDIVCESEHELKPNCTKAVFQRTLFATLSGHQVEETVVNVDEGVFVTADVRDVQVVGGRANLDSVR